jgi:hypothetical protein
MDTPTKVLAEITISKKFGSYFSKNRQIDLIKIYNVRIHLYHIFKVALQLESCFYVLKQAIVCASRFFRPQFGLKYKLFYGSYNNSLRKPSFGSRYCFSIILKSIKSLIKSLL